jgi:ABC-type transporter Mla subunit MlaD
MSDTLESVIIKDLIENLNLWAESYSGKPISHSLFDAAAILGELERRRDEAREAMREAWLAMDELVDASERIIATNRIINWQNKHANIWEAAK